MRASTTSGLALALMLAGGLAACSGDENAAVPPADEPAQTGSIPADPIAPAAPPAEPLTEPDPMATPPAEDDTVQ